MSELIYPVEYSSPVIRGAVPEKGEEMLPVVNELGVVQGQTTRTHAHSGDHPLHPVVHLHILDRFGRIYLQKRSVRKKLLPGYWDTAVGGHVSYGESIREALFREASEEVGLCEFNPIFLKSYVWESKTESELVYVFAILGSFSPVPDKDEVEEGRFWTPEEIEEAAGKKILTPNFEQEYESLSKVFQSLL